MTIEAVVSRWRTEQTRFEELGALVDGAKLIGRILDDLETAQFSEERNLSMSLRHEGD